MENFLGHLHGLSNLRKSIPKLSTDFQTYAKDHSKSIEKMTRLKNEMRMAKAEGWEFYL